MMLVAGPPGVDHLMSLIRGILPGLRLLTSETNYLELLPAEACKGAALRFLAAQHGVSMDEIAAMGDIPNDVDMVEAAGLGASVGDEQPGCQGSRRHTSCSANASGSPADAPTWRSRKPGIPGSEKRYHASPHLTARSFGHPHAKHTQTSTAAHCPRHSRTRLNARREHSKFARLVRPVLN
ncbi:HAD hydrolase family protein [Lentzea sp. HUAS12]|nr:HAD hydrolase family protein [Lentzea sp. HUAS12]